MTVPQTDIELGAVVRDPVSGMEGVVISIAEHISGCTRICARSHSDDTSERSDEEWFYEAQLDVANNTDAAVPEAEDAVTTTDVNLGDRVADDITGFEGIVTTIAYDVFNCPRVALTPVSEEATKRPDREWFDVPRVEVVETGVHDEYEDLTREAEAAETGAGPEDIVRKEER